MGKRQLLELNQKTITGPAFLTKIMPAPLVEEATEYISAGPLVIGIEYRYLQTVDPEEGVCLHVFADSPAGRTEHLRFDCFKDGPHYHYLTWSEHRQVVFPMDSVANGDPLAWAIECLRNRLPSMLTYAGAQALAEETERYSTKIDDAIPKIWKAARTAQRRSETGT